MLNQITRRICSHWFQSMFCEAKINNINNSIIFAIKRRNSSCLVIAEHDNKHFNPSTANAISAAKKLATTDINILIAGTDCNIAATALGKTAGVSKLLIAQNAALQGFLAETMTDLALKLIEKNKYTHIVAAETTMSKNFLPRLAAKLDVAPINEVVAIKSADTFQRAIYAGSALLTLTSNDKIKILLIRSPSFEKDKLDGGTPTKEDVGALVKGTDKVQFLKEYRSTSTRPELTSARIVVSGGRGVGSKENFTLIYNLADKLKGAVGASRAAVDAGFISNEYQVGQTGKIVAPELYIAVGISGAIQHLAGMKDSKVIVAINKDPEAPIFSIATFGLVGDLFQVVPNFVAKL